MHDRSHLHARSTGRLAFALVLLVLFVAALSGCSAGAPDARPSIGQPSQDPAPTPSQPEIASVKTKVVRVIDGDTIAVETVPGVLEANGDDPEEHVMRLLGIDAPEMNLRKPDGPDCGAKEATHHLEQTLPVGMPVTAAFDPEADRTDRYGRSLAYVTTRGGTDAGLRQVADGYAMPWYPKDEPQPERVPEYRIAADAASSQRLGAHAQCPSIGR